jgi:hypothetical protein
MHVYAWGNNPRRAEMKGRRCVIEARGRMGTVLVRFLDTGERVTTSYRALRMEEPEVGLEPTATGLQNRCSAS